MVKNVTSHIFSLNFGYGMEFRKKKIEYYNEFASFVDDHTILLDDRQGKTH